MQSLFVALLFCVGVRAMKRPADQVKLLFFYLLRSSVSAIATEGSSTKAASFVLSSSASVASSTLASTASPNGSLLNGHICVRLARRSDVPSIQRCNLATLPENYNAQFYCNHLRQWPDLAIVAEHVAPQSENESSSQILSRGLLPGQSSEPKIVAYVLGKIEERTIKDTSSSAAFLYALDEDELLKRPRGIRAPPPSPRREKLGHVTSLAVRQEYRRQGLAAALMDQLHLHLSSCYGSFGVGLHVRKSNTAATSLYRSDGYEVEEVIKGYYQDGEDAFFMRKSLEPESPQNGGGIQQWRFRRDRPWEDQDSPLSLPRIMPFRQRSSKEDRNPQEAHNELEEEELEVMTGTM